MFDFLKNNPLASGAASARFRPRSVLIHFLLFFVVMTVGEAVAGIPVGLYASYRLVKILGIDFFLPKDPAPSTEEMVEKMNAAAAEIAGEDVYLLISLFSMLLLGLIALLYCRLIERRPLASMGLRCPSRRELLRYGIGLASGLAMFLVTGILLVLTGAVSVSSGTYQPLMLVLYLFAFLIQGAAEEILVRGYFMVSLTTITSPQRALLCSAFLFALMHVENVGFSFLAVLNIFLFGILLGLIVFRTQSLALAAALHGIWNFAEGNLLGLPVSGLVPKTSVLSSALEEARLLTNGGAFGPEGGAVVSAVLLLALAVFVLLLPKSGEATLDR